MNSNLSRVRDINWADPTINRAGILPIYVEDNKIWIGLGISTFSTNINTIGGSYENKDYDLLETAVREYNEEVGSNMKHITSESLYNYYAVKSEYEIIILQVVSGNHNFKFTKTEELYDILWVTPYQLKLIHDLSETLIPKTKIKAFSLSSGFKLIIPMILEAITTGIVFNIQDDKTRLVRSKKVITQNEALVITNYNEFVLDSQEDISKFSGLIILILDKDNRVIGIMRNDFTTYILPIDRLPAVINILNNIISRVASTIIVNDIRTRSAILAFNVIPGNKIYSIEENGRRSRELLKQFNMRYNSLPQTNNITDLVGKLALIKEFEFKMYEERAKSTSYFNKTRACLLDILNQANLLINADFDYNFLLTYISRYSKCNPDEIAPSLGFLIEKGFFTYNRANKKIAIN